jgi:HlyD family secretion protein
MPAQLKKIDRDTPTVDLAPPSLADPQFDPFIDVPQVPRWAGRTIYLLVLLLVVLSGWAAVAKLDVVVIGHGRLIEQSEQVNLQVFETSVVRSIEVRIGQRVKKGDRVAVLDSTFTTADRDDLETQVGALTAAVRRLRAEIDRVPYSPSNPNSSEMAQVRIYNERQAERDSRLNSLNKKVDELKPQLEFTEANEGYLSKQLELARQLVSMNQELSDKGLVSKRALLEAKTRELDVLSKVTENKRDKGRLSEAILIATSDRNAFVNEWSRKLAEEFEKMGNERETAAAKLTKAKRRSDLITMTAPVDGSVLDIPKRNVGSVLREGETLMTLVPADATMPLDVTIDSKDVAFLRIGQKVTIKFEALPYQEYGSAYGVLTALTFDTTSEAPSSGEGKDTPQAANNKRYYRAQISVDRKDFHNLPEGFEFRSGMRATAEIKVGLRTLAAYLLHPVTRVFHEGLRER